MEQAGVRLYGAERREAAALLEAEDGPADRLAAAPGGHTMRTGGSAQL